MERERSDEEAELLTIVAALVGIVLRISVLAVVPLGAGRLLGRLRHRLLWTPIAVVHTRAKRSKVDEVLLLPTGARSVYRPRGVMGYGGGW